MLQKIIITAVLILAAVLVFSGCDKVEQVGESMEDAIESRLDPIEDAIESKIDPIEDAIESKIDPIEDAIESKLDPIENAVESKAEAVEDAIESNWHSLMNQENKQTEPAKTQDPGTTDKHTSVQNTITKEQARDIALRHANVTADDVRFLKSEIDHENGKWVYEVSFRIGNIEYEYDILADSGKIVKSEKDFDD